MSTFRAKRDYGFVGLGSEPVRVSENQEFDGDHELVKARPELFDAVPEEPKRPVLHRKPKGEDDRP